MKRQSLDELIYESQFRQLGDDFSIPVKPLGISKPNLVIQSPTVSEILGISPSVCSTQPLLDIFSGNASLQNSTPAAQAYAGHQFGKFNPFLGDGRTLLLGEVGTQNDHWEISLKGAGKTPFTFASDGRAGLTECQHEYDISERLAFLGVPTTRCLCIVKGSEQVYRNRFESVAMLTRVTPCHIRFGTFERYYFNKNVPALKALTDHVIQHYFPHCLGNDADGNNDYGRFFQDVIIKTAQLIAHWQQAGFVHGMMNTDNQSILGVSLDLGESTFTEDLDDDFVASPSDRKGRYAFGQQPAIGLWNCNVLARALSPLIKPADLRHALTNYEPAFINFQSR
ncbi:MAG: hypothetical protein ACJA0I_001287 [Gammaproteobacteria bacterium]|jgi:uncharacterized protein YdiU (UPF0061 family)